MPADRLDDALDAGVGPGVADGIALRADLTTRPDGPDECILYPVEPTDDKYTTTWLAAEGDAFVALDEMR